MTGSNASPRTCKCPERTRPLVRDLQDDDYKAAEREREHKRDRSTRERPKDDGAQAALRKKAKRDEQAERIAQSYRVVNCGLFIKRAVGLSQEAIKASQVDCSCERSRFLCSCPRFDPVKRAAEYRAASERDWQERARIGRDVVLQRGQHVGRRSD